MQKRRRRERRKIRGSKIGMTCRLCKRPLKKHRLAEFCRIKERL